ncbi:gluconate 2-dehydrogenase subunit 3 family protein [Paenibacillus sabuli]|uniref:gluconate 2-dehydrogenase subunit 3 family protein n=1 Tax=Paenibacillus sabuli TaxID=2772509 RepID=UPI0037C6C550
MREPSRRRFLARSGIALGGLVVGGALGALIGRETGDEGDNTAPPAADGEQQQIPANFNRALMHFSQDQFRIVDAAMERIYPADDSGPGASLLGAAFFIDHQLAGEYGFNGRDYMSPPFYAGEKQQGYQGRLKRREIYDIGIQELENYSLAAFDAGFAELTGEQQDEVLQAFESDSVGLTTISASAFFTMLRANTLEGIYSDPLYGGNANMDGWRMRDYPGNQMSYTTVIDQPFEVIEPSSLQQHMTGH